MCVRWAYIFVNKTWVCWYHTNEVRTCTESHNSLFWRARLFVCPFVGFIITIALHVFFSHKMCSSLHLNVLLFILCECGNQPKITLLLYYIQWHRERRGEIYKCIMKRNVYVIICMDVCMYRKQYLHACDSLFLARFILFAFLSRLIFRCCHFYSPGFPFSLLLD